MMILLPGADLPVYATCDAFFAANFPSRYLFAILYNVLATSAVVFLFDGADAGDAPTDDADEAIVEGAGYDFGGLVD